MDNSQAHCHRWHRSTALDMAENLVTRRSSIADRGCPPARDGAGIANVCPTSNPRHTKEESEEHAITHEETPSDFVAIGIVAVEPPGHGARMGRRLGDQRQHEFVVLRHAREAGQHPCLILHARRCVEVNAGSPTSSTRDKRVQLYDRGLATPRHPLRIAGDSGIDHCAEPVFRILQRPFSHECVLCPDETARLLVWPVRVSIAFRSPPRTRSTATGCAEMTHY